MSSEEIKSIFGEKVRVRVMGLFRQEDKLLLLKHRGLNESNELWLPPGGGLEFGEGLMQCLVREFKEELGVEITVGDFLFFSEFRSDHLHAVELFFSIDQLAGELKLGKDPELGTEQLLIEYKFMSWEEIKSKPETCFHPVFQKLRNMEELFRYRGFFNFGNNA